MQHDRHIELKKRPDLSEVVLSLRGSGRHDVADMISRLLGPQVKIKDGELGKFRFAYLFVNRSEASMDDQSKMIHGFVNGLQKMKNPGLGVLLENMELIPITLPKNIVVLAMRIPLSLYNESSLPSIVKNHAFISVYLRKPRKDTQHLALQQSQKQEVRLNDNPTESQPTRKGKGVANA